MTTALLAILFALTQCAALYLVCYICKKAGRKTPSFMAPNEPDGIFVPEALRGNDNLTGSEIANGIGCPGGTERNFAPLSEGPVNSFKNPLTRADSPNPAPPCGPQRNEFTARASDLRQIEVSARGMI